MVEINELNGNGVRSKIATFVRYINTCMFCTRGMNFPFHTRPMATAQVDQDGIFWFMSNRYSRKNKDILMGSSVQLIYSQPGDTHFLSVYGNASVVVDRDKLEELWTPQARNWFKQGIDDPDITLIKITPIEAHYWNTRLGKMMPLIALPSSPVSGVRMGDGVVGQLAV